MNRPRMLSAVDDGDDLAVDERANHMLAPIHPFVPGVQATGIAMIG